MSIHTVVAAIVAATLLSACTYVERTPPAPAVVQAPPTVITPVPAAPPTVTVRPAY